jgi:dolichol-phosphate mannosyltransferase
MMDGDGQNDPRDFPRLLAAMREQGKDMMCGIRAKRQDSIVRKISSKIGNGFRNWLTSESVTDVGCSIRVFRRRFYERIKLYEGMHRFFPTLFRMEGATIGEIPVSHRPRTKGVSKYGIGNRAWRGFKDCLAVRWMQTRALRYELQKKD